MSAYIKRLSIAGLVILWKKIAKGLLHISFHLINFTRRNDSNCSLNMYFVRDKATMECDERLHQATLNDSTKDST